MRRLVAGKLVRHTVENPGGPTGASLRGRLLTISVHTVLSLKSLALDRQQSKTPGSQSNQRSCDDRSMIRTPLVQL